MDTSTWSTPDLPPLVALVVRDPSWLAHPPSGSRLKEHGHTQWPLTPDGPGQALLTAVLQAAQAHGLAVPEHLCVQAGHLVYHQQRLVDVRLSGTYPATPLTSRLWRERPWTTPTPPPHQLGPDGTLPLTPPDAEHVHLAVLVVAETTAAPGFVVHATWAVPTTALAPTPPPLVAVPKPPPVSNAFAGERGTIPANPLIAAGMAAIWKGGPKARHLQGGWQRSETGRPVYQQHGRKGGRILVYPQATPSPTAPLPTADTLWKLVEDLTPFTADVDLRRAQISVQETKNRERRPLPLASVALTTVQQLAKVRRLDTPLLFPRADGRRPLDIRHAWAQAVRQAQLTDFRFHDLRHCCASYLAMSGASLTDIAAILGHKTLQMVQRYAHLSEAHTAGVVARMNAAIFPGRA